MTLNDIERQSALWIKLRAEFIDRLSVLRARNDGALDEIETAKLRGRIAQIKDFLMLEATQPSQPADE